MVSITLADETLELNDCSVSLIVSKKPQKNRAVLFYLGFEDYAKLYDIITYDIVETITLRFTHNEKDFIQFYNSISVEFIGDNATIYLENV